MSYTIDGQTIEGNNWRQLLSPGGPTDRGEETFPGDATVYLSIGERLADGAVITGMLEADTVPALIAAQKTEAARLASTTLSDIHITGVTYDNQHLASFEPSGEIIPFRDGADVRFMVRVKYLWRGVQP